MAINIEDVKAICKDISTRVERSYSGLSLYFIIHPHGKMKETMAVSEHEIVMHPAGEAARIMLRKHHNGEKSSFLGLAISKEKKLLGLQSKDHLLGLYTLNINDFKSIGDVKAHIYHSAWHAIDLYEIRKVPQYRKKFRSGPMVPKRSDLNLSKANLQADVFSMMLLTLEGQSKAIDIIGKKRGLQSINQQIDYKAESFPTVIAVESCRIAMDDLIALDVVPDNYVTQARLLSVEVGQTYDEENIQQWWNFTIPAQDMAWRGFTSEEILYTAINTSHDPYVRSTGLLVAEVTGIDYESDVIDERAYNSFTDPDKNLVMHKELVDSLFEEVIQQGVEEASYRPFLNAANKQNESLTNGNILGWCANALQDAANAFERALINGTAPEQAARMQFESNKEEPQWSDLKDLSDKIIEKKRQGVTMTMGHVAEICDNQLSFSPMLNSVTVTMKDPAYIQKLEAANDLNAMPKSPAPTGLNIKGPAPSGPAPTQELAAAPKTPAPGMPAPGMPAPGMGGPGGMGGGAPSQAQIMYQRHLEAKRAEEKTQQKMEEHRTE